VRTYSHRSATFFFVSRLEYSYATPITMLCFPPRHQKREYISPQQPPSPQPDFRGTANGGWRNQQQRFAPHHSAMAFTSVPSLSATNEPSMQPVQPQQQQQFVHQFGHYGAAAQQPTYGSSAMMRGSTQHNTMQAATVGGPWCAPPPPLPARAHTYMHWSRSLHCAHAVSRS
jgi:hypothetical protein